ncbi:dTDP-4-amino-4,6-dideoxygalactose transaminase [Oceanobacillus rekensis]|uniref:dTDP-4-amino-4,6-dideoxygalactose transaminase n=1 Tax=Oceanobacillus rekensis TaxID=937927 RepID=UPI000B442EC6|nr:dTDP-4-amino-4,6-dideoxygalactose transaminase [Oceanobacillus rekensis]
MIPFNKPCVIGTEHEAIKEAIELTKISGNGSFGKRCTLWLEERLECDKAILTPSCTAALEMTALLSEVGAGDEVIMPSYTFVSTANAFALRGASIRFVDVSPETMNIDPDKIREAVTERTKAIVVVHYAGVSCDMDAIMEIAKLYGLWVIEDAAQGLLSKYKGKPLGTIGHMGTFSFHETKNYTCGEGGALIINEPSLVERAEIIQEKGTDRSQFLKGMVDKYSWRDLGSSYLLSELNAAYLSVQLEYADKIYENRMRAWEQYRKGLQSLADTRLIAIPTIPVDCEHNAHMFYLKTRDEMERSNLIQYLKKNGIMAVPHYVPLHTSAAGKKFGNFIGDDRYTTADSDRLLRLPIYYGMKEEDVEHGIKIIQQYYQA